MARRSLALLLATVFATGTASAPPLEPALDTDDTCADGEGQDGCSLQLRQLRARAKRDLAAAAEAGGQGARHWPVPSDGCACDWIPSDDCRQQNFCAKSCRSANPWGPCGSGADVPSGPAPSPSAVPSDGCDCSWIPTDDCSQENFCAFSCRKANPWGPCGSGTINPPNTPSPAPSAVPADDCDCSWIPTDNCLQHTRCAVACRQANPWGPCGSEAPTNAPPTAAPSPTPTCPPYVPGGTNHYRWVVGDCDCCFLPVDDCSNMDYCRQRCRETFSWGPCGSR